MISASQTDKGRDCLRRWLFDWNTPFDQRPPKGQAAEDGLALHKIGEDYHVHGKAPDRHTRHGQMFYPALEFVPRPRVGRAEGEFHLTVAGIDYTGLIDLECRASDLPRPQLSFSGDMPAVIDYKGKPNLSHPSILEGPGDFYNDPQAVIYAARTLVRCQADRVYMRWVYIKREGPAKAKASDCIMTRAETSAAFGRIVHPTARVLVALKKKKPDPLLLPPNPASCLRYGPKWACPHIDKCNLSPAEKALALEEQRPTEETMNDLLSMLENLPDNTQKAEAANPPAALREPGINPPEAQRQAAPEEKIAEVKAQASVQETRALGSFSDVELGHALRVLAAFLFGR